ncbi:ecdysteroid 22-kinase family protein [Novosphingobium sp. G106]|uniref:phosphotransferase n=1 Tax=Novosphingobium sp. G106 TaxID=2849500 RepID=UPI001C2D853E|nr:phosphotransferase [Novosphingobium sp. G106]MBV1688917.1 ecdysteroid 22-kinase family protein [Novosphingobium sp. G106]
MALKAEATAVGARGPGVPTEAEGLTAAWFQAAFQNQFPGAKVSSVRLVERIRGASTKLRIAIESNRTELPKQVMVKAGYEPHSAAMAIMHMNEMHAYRDLIPTLNVTAPRCFFADQQDGRGLVVLEDLTLSNVSFLSLQEPLEFEHAAGFLDCMARFHARWWGVDDLPAKFPWAAETRAMQESHYFDILLDPDQFAEYKAAPRCAAMPRVLLDPERVASAHVALAELHDQLPHTMLHGDAHLGNLYCESDGSPAFLDWQPRRGPWVLDVAYFIVAALDLVDRRRWEAALLQHYLARLAAYGVIPPTFDEAFDAYRRNTVWGLLIWMLNGSHFQTETNNTAAATRFAMAMIDHDTFARLGV